MDDIGRAGADAVYVAKSVNYTVGSSTRLMYAAAGGADDYACGLAEIPICYTIEVSGDDVGFEATPDQIEPLVKESWIVIKAMAKALMRKFP